MLTLSGTHDLTPFGETGAEIATVFRWLEGGYGPLFVTSLSAAVRYYWYQWGKLELIGLLYHQYPKKDDTGCGIKIIEGQF